MFLLTNFFIYFELSELQKSIDNHIARNVFDTTYTTRVV